MGGSAGGLVSECLHLSMSVCDASGFEMLPIVSVHCSFFWGAPLEDPKLKLGDTQKTNYTGSYALNRKPQYVSKALKL